ncbi:MAG: hypothetical protein L0J14_00700, partial [Bifidobacterium crudilactis]|nr:hypothetical protein [Bifidobacterium crudilactis]
PRRRYFAMVTRWAAQNAWHEEFPEQAVADALATVSAAGERTTNSFDDVVRQNDFEASTTRIV